MKLKPADEHRKKLASRTRKQTAIVQAMNSESSVLSYATLHQKSPSERRSELMRTKMARRE